MMFGKGLSVRERFDNIRMDYIDESNLLPGSRWSDRLTYDGMWENNLYNFIRQVTPSVTTRLYLGKPVPYSGTGASNFGYRDTSFSLALSVVKCQQMFAPAWFRSVSHAASSCRSSSMSAILRVRHCRVMTLSFISAMSSQLPCFGV